MKRPPKHGPDNGIGNHPRSIISNKNFWTMLLALSAAAGLNLFFVTRYVLDPRLAFQTTTTEREPLSSSVVRKSFVDRDVGIDPPVGSNENTAGGENEHKIEDEDEKREQPRHQQQISDRGKRKTNEHDATKPESGTREASPDDETIIVAAVNAANNHKAVPRPLETTAHKHEAGAGAGAGASALLHPAEQIVEFTPRIKSTVASARRKKLRKENKEKNANRTLSPEEKLKYTYVETAIMSNRSHTEFYRDIPPEYLVVDPSAFVWDREVLKIPEWMKDYFRWHRWKRTTWKDLAEQDAAKTNNKNNNNTALGEGEIFGSNDPWWKSERWLISQCLKEQDQRKCGGTSDRLKPIATLLKIAYDYKRVFLIRWTRPALLEEFLQPPEGGFDWRVPPELLGAIGDKSNGKRLSTVKPLSSYSRGGMALIRSRLQLNDPGGKYDGMMTAEENNKTTTTTTTTALSFDEPSHDTVFSSVWKVSFTPAPAVQKILRSSLARLGLVPNGYTAAHLRALYAVDSRPTELIHRFTRNALACATEAFSGVPIFFASDAAIALEHARSFDGTDVFDGDNKDEGRYTSLRVATAGDGDIAEKSMAQRDTDPSAIEQQQQQHRPQKEPWHLDSYTGPVENFYDTFVDLYLLAMARCVTYNKGGYGHWGMLIGGHTSCAKPQAIIKSGYKAADLCRFRARVASDEDGDQKTNHGDDSVGTQNNSASGQAGLSLSSSVFGNDGDAGPIFLPPMG